MRRKQANLCGQEVNMGDPFGNCGKVGVGCIASGPLTSKIGNGAVRCFAFLHGVQKWHALAEAAKIVWDTACNARCLHGASCLYGIVSI